MPQSAQPDANAFLDTDALMTLGGSILAVVVIVNAIRHAFNWGPRWFAFSLSIITSLVAAFITGFTFSSPDLIQNLFLIFINGCLIYTSAFGIQNNLIAQQGQQPPVVSPPAVPAARDLEVQPNISYRSAW